LDSKIRRAIELYYNLVLPQRFTFIQILAISALSFCLPAMAQEQNLVVIDSEQYNGWQQLHDSYISGYPDRNGMGFIQPKRIQVKLLKPDLALALTWWSVSFPSSKQKVVWNTTMNLQKIDDGWKIVASHTSFADL
jgi:hypothetical protein